MACYCHFMITILYVVNKKSPQLNSDNQFIDYLKNSEEKNIIIV